MGNISKEEVFNLLLRQMERAKRRRHRINGEIINDYAFEKQERDEALDEMYLGNIDLRLDKEYTPMDLYFEEERQRLNEEYGKDMMMRNDILFSLSGNILHCTIEELPDGSYNNCFNPDIQGKDETDEGQYLRVRVEYMLLEYFDIDYAYEEIYIDDYIYELVEYRDFKLSNGGHLISLGKRLK